MSSMRIIILLSTLLTVACTTYVSPIPDEYIGDTANIADSISDVSHIGGKFFVVDKIDDQNIFNALDRSINLSSGQGARIEAEDVNRDVPANTELKLDLVATTYYPAPIVGMFQKNLRYQAEAQLITVANYRYQVRGRLTQSNSILWVELSDLGSTDTLFEPSAELYNAFSSLAPGVSLAEVESQIGKAQGSVKIRSKGQDDVIQEFYDLQYYGLGTVRFNGEGANSILLNVLLAPRSFKQEMRFLEETESAEPEINADQSNLGSDKSTGDIDYEMIRQKRVERIFERLPTAQGQAMQVLGKKVFNEGVLDETQLDIAAQKLWFEQNADDEYTEDGVAYLCKSLMINYNSRYRLLLQKVQEESQSRKIRRYAKSALETMPIDDGIEQFKPWEQ